MELAQTPQIRRMVDEQRVFADSPVDDLRDLLDSVRGKSILGVPLLMKGQTTGIVLLIDTMVKRQFSQREVGLAQALVLQAANALSAT